MGGTTNIQGTLGLDLVGLVDKRKAPIHHIPEPQNAALFSASSPLFNLRHPPLCGVGHGESRDPGSAQHGFKLHHCVAV